MKNDLSDSHVSKTELLEQGDHYWTKKLLKPDDGELLQHCAKAYGLLKNPEHAITYGSPSMTCDNDI